MEVDLHNSPSFRTIRSKRPRSPEGSPLERPPKRLSLAIISGDAVTIASPMSALGHRYINGPWSSPSSSRHPSEDWVRQADELSIDSPVIPVADPFLGVAVEKQQQDEDMNMEHDEVVRVDHERRPELPLIQTTEYAQVSYAQAAFMRRQHENQRFSDPTPPSSSMTPGGPMVNILPPTPVPPPPPYQNVEPVPRSSSSVLNSPMAITSPIASYINMNSPRKQRFTMGPRADCEKCRLGVKGHSVHY
ncbi:hypothetical protein BDZ94DRAFT_1319611 [Collybia nuda]|uniref:Uncharacterized protein n=1 Tax=Collybia nuda TaxID=64659 RepID=A0A9P5YAG4_9AGAR|nr:hypothetical protein BDZ94DRAFT_1319611 [Collybia nuda]